MTHPNLASELEVLNRDLCAILIAKTENEAQEKISGVPQGEGAWAYIRMHRWFRQTIEQGMINRRTNIMKPDPVKHDYMLASAIEEWEERYRSLVEEEDEDELPEKFQNGCVKKHADWGHQKAC